MRWRGQCGVVMLCLCVWGFAIDRRTAVPPGSWILDYVGFHDGKAACLHERRAVWSAYTAMMRRFRDPTRWLLGRCLPISDVTQWRMLVPHSGDVIPEYVPDPHDRVNVLERP